jgi:FecR protein
MLRCLLFLIPALVCAAPARYARVGDFDGQVEVQLTPADPWMPAERNLPLPESAWIRTGPSSRIEIELDEGSVWRLGPESQGGLSDYTRHSTGQRVTMLLLERGLAYFSGSSSAPDSLLLVVPGAQVSVTRAARLRFEAADVATQLAVLQGVARFSSPAAEIDVAQGQTSRVEPAHPNRFFLYREVTPIDLDRWSAERDKTLSSAISGLHVPQRYGLADLDSTGQWVQTDDLGAVWQPKAAEGWTPYRSGRWRWLDGLGYVWVSDESWGWLPYHYGRWTKHGDLGWVWAPTSNGVFKPGEVFWMRGARFAAWGPLAPSEDWNPPSVPAQFAGANVTFASFIPETPKIDPAGFKDPPKEPLKAATFVAALPSPAFPASRLDALRPLVSVNGLRVMPEGSSQPSASIDRAPQPTVIVTPPASAPETSPEQVEVPVPVPVYLGFVVTPTPAPPAKTVSPVQTGPIVSSGKPAPKPVTIPAPLPPHNPRRPIDRPRDGQEGQTVSRVQSDIETGRWTKALDDLDDWTRRYPQSQLVALRLYDYMQAHSALAHPDRVLEYGAQVLASNPMTGEGALNEQQTAAVLYLTMVNAGAIAKPSQQQRALGAAAAQSLLDSLPRYFEDNRRPSGTNSDQWTGSRKQLETAARDSLRKLALVAQASQPAQ